MYIDQNIPQSGWTIANIPSLKINQVINKAAYYAKLWLGRLGLVLLLGLGFVLIIPAYFFLKYQLRKAIRLLEPKINEYLKTISDTEQQDYLKKWRFVSSKQIELSRIIREIDHLKSIRKVSSGLILKKFIHQEDIFLSQLSQFNTQLENALYPNLRKTYSQAELKDMMPRSELQDDLDDIALDELIEKQIQK